MSQQQSDPSGPEALEQGTPPGMSPDDVEQRSQMARFLDPSHFPASRDALIETAQRHQAPDVVLDRLRHLPADQEFENMQEVARAAGLGTEERRT